MTLFYVTLVITLAEKAKQVEEIVTQVN